MTLPFNLAADASAPPRPAKNPLSLIGNTPIVEVTKFDAGPGQLFLKLEGANPGGSIKDRPALAMIEAAERDGRLKPGGAIVEATTGNTGLGLALVSAAKGYRLILVIPDKMSREKIFHLPAPTLGTGDAPSAEHSRFKAEQPFLSVLRLHPDEILDGRIGAERLHVVLRRQPRPVAIAAHDAEEAQGLASGGAELVPRQRRNHYGVERLDGEHFVAHQAMAGAATDQHHMNVQV
jgi:hypothetical protein